MKKSQLIPIALVLLLTSCGPSQQEIDAMIDKKVSAALTALPTETTIPTSVPQKIEMPIPIAEPPTAEGAVPLFPALETPEGFSPNLIIEYGYCPITGEFMVNPSETPSCVVIEKIPMYRDPGQEVEIKPYGGDISQYAIFCSLYTVENVFISSDIGRDGVAYCRP
jgi:hypothetical protein